VRRPLCDAAESRVTPRMPGGWLCGTAAGAVDTPWILGLLSWWTGKSKKPAWTNRILAGAESRVSRRNRAVTNQIKWTREPLSWTLRVGPSPRTFSLFFFFRYAKIALVRASTMKFREGL
jgi:hypothetical protein